MTCLEVERILPDAIDCVDEDIEFQAHLKSCPACAALVAELRSIASEARELSESAEPPARVWVRIANQLRAEGIIYEPETAHPRPQLVPAPSRRWNAWWFAPVAVAILAAGSYQLSHKKASPSVSQLAQQPAKQQSSAQPMMAAQQSAQSTPNQATSATPSPTQQSPLHASAAMNSRVQTVQHRILPNRPVQVDAPLDAEGPSNADDQRFLTEVSERAPSLRATYENELRAVNAEIRETQAYIRRYPADMDARQHLMEAYQQKALLYQMALDRIQ